MNRSLYARLLGDRYAVLPAKVRELHAHDGDATYAGRCRVRRGTNFLANILADILSLPRAAEDTNVAVRFIVRGNGEEWHRTFDNKKFKSVQWQKGAYLYERLNLTTLVFRVDTDPTMLDLVLEQVYILGLPVKSFLRPVVIARETETNGAFHFFIRTSLPLVGLIIEYTGNLERVN